ncbi:MAG: RsmB/NOP family class I SAM-dependent RNA methyltransferase, partial [Lachnospiraceae bacterium]|nr:RsmB/NOP family class I SAM-dependent RNA methyltransferase [Lachnospiraceae bacterium]
MTLPESYIQNMKELLGEDFDAYMESFSEIPAHGLRVNTGKLSTEDFINLTKLELTQVPWIKNGFYYEDAAAPARHPHYYAGLYYLQEPSAMTPANRLDVQPGHKVLDLCAAPGGKATELGSRLKGEGMLLANDISMSRARALLKNLELAGIPNLLVSAEDPIHLAPAYPEYFDRILIDAPCSGEGMFRREHSMIEYWKEAGPDNYVPVQRSILESGIRMLKKGGKLLYSTCTFALKEDEENIRWILEQYPEMHL